MDKKPTKLSAQFSSEQGDITASADANSENIGSSINGKKPYKKPELVSHGSLSDLTKFGGSSPLFDFFARRF